MKTTKRRWLAVSLVMAMVLSMAMPSGQTAYAAETALANEAAPEAAAEELQMAAAGDDTAREKAAENFSAETEAEDDATLKTAAENDAAGNEAADDNIAAAVSDVTDDTITLEASGATKTAFTEDTVSVELDQDTYDYTGSAIKPAVTVTLIGTNATVLKLNTDYTVTYSDNVNIGTATVKITGKGSYSGTMTTAFVIQKSHSPEINAAASKTELQVGDTSQITVNENFSGYTYTISDSSEEDGKEVISVDDNGLVTALNPGSAVVLIRLPESDLSYGNWDTITFYVGEVTYKTAAYGDTLTQTYSEDSVIYQMTPTASYFYNFRSTSDVSTLATIEIYKADSGEKVARSMKASTTDTNDFDWNCWMDAGTTYNLVITTSPMVGQDVSDCSVKIGKSVITLTSANALSNGIRVNWERLGNTSQTVGYYLVYRKPADGSSGWKKIGKTILNYYDDHTAVSGTVYLYTVRAASYVNDTDAGSNYDTTGVTGVWLAACAAPTLTNTAAGVTVTWKAVTGAQGYIVYRKTTGSYSSIATIKSGKTVTYTDKTVAAKNGTTYTYTVRPYLTLNGVTLKGAYTGKSILRLTAPTISSLTNVKTRSMVAKWNRNTKATGYQVQYSLNKNFTSATTVKITSNATVSRTISSLTKGKTYYVRVRSYRTVSSTNYYSAWSATKYVKISK